MPIDATSDPYDGTPGVDPSSTKVNVDDADDVTDSKFDDSPAAKVDDDDPKVFDDDLEAAGTGARTVDLDLGGIDKGGDLDDGAGPTGKADLDLDVDLDDAGNGAKVDPSLDDDDPIGKGLGSALDEVDVDDDSAVKDFDLDQDDNVVGKGDFDLDGPDDLDGAGVKGLLGIDLEHDDDLGPDAHDDLDDDVKDEDLFDL